METQTWLNEARRLADRIRRRVLEHTIRNHGGYMSQACSSAELLAFLYGRLLNLAPLSAPLAPRPFLGVPGPANEAYRTGADFHGPPLPHLDRFILSPTHYSLVLYSALIEAGRMTPDGLLDFNRDGSSVEMIGAEHSPGMEVMTGSLGQGLGQAVGMALGRRLKGETGRTVLLMSDGEFQIGMTWESVQFLAHHRLDRVLVLVDANGQQCDGTVDSVMTVEPLVLRLEAFGAVAVEVDGHDLEALETAAATPHPGRPLFIIGRTDPCRGLPLLRQNAPRLHYLRFKSPEEKAGYAQALAAWKEVR